MARANSPSSKPAQYVSKADPQHHEAHFVLSNDESFTLSQFSAHPSDEAYAIEAYAIKAKHMARHEMPHVCNVGDCQGKRFPNASELRRHQKGKHILQFPNMHDYRCAIPNCHKAGMVFARLDYFVNHLRKVHPSVDFRSAIASAKIRSDLSTVPSLANKQSESIMPVTNVPAHVSGNLDHSQALKLFGDKFMEWDLSHDQVINRDIVNTMSRVSTGKGEETVGKRGVAMQKDLPFTDSGFASGYNLNDFSNLLSSIEISQLQAKNDSSTANEDADREDIKTQYSSATIIAPAHSQNYIASLCDDIHSKVGQCFDAKRWSKLSSALPALIKAFAIRIGHESPVQMNQDIMYFIHSRHRQITTLLEAVFCQKDERESEAGRDTFKGMSVLDKMNLWNSQDGEAELPIKDDDLFEGVKDMEDETVNLADSPAYKDVTLDSAAYKWFLASLAKESVLQLSTTQQRPAIEDIRKTILEKLPTGKISRRQGPETHTITFELAWDSHMLFRLLGENFAPSIYSDCSFDDLIITGSAEEAQAVTMKQYLSQTWPEDGLLLLDVLKKTVSSGNQYSVQLSHCTRLDAMIVPPQLLHITASGPAYFIAECGEQISWLGAAFLSTTEYPFGHCMPSIKSWNFDQRSSALADSRPKGYCRIGFEFADFVKSTDPSPVTRNSWQDVIGKTYFISGFPISRRPDGYPGLEISFANLLRLLKAENATITGAKVVITGLEQELQLIKYTDNVYLWHEIHAATDDCSCCMRHGFETRSADLDSLIDFQSLETGRHILSSCIGTNAIFDKTEGSDNKIFHYHTLAEAKPAKGPWTLSKLPATMDAKQESSVLSLPEDEGNLSQLTDSRKVYEGVKSSLSKPNVGTSEESSAFDPRLGSEGLPIPIAIISPSESSDSELLSISDSSEQGLTLNSNEPTHRFLEAVLDQLLCGYRSVTHCQPSSGEGSRQSAASVSATNPAIRCTSTQPGKRKRGQENDGEDVEDGFPRPSLKKIRSGQGHMPRKLLACPYFKLNPMKCSACCAKRLNRVRDVKQHLRRRHTPARYCQRCLVTDFADEKTLTTHVRLNNCTFKDPALLEGVSHDQDKQLSKKSDRNLSEEDQWFAIWEILFPGLSRPISAYVDTGWSTEMCRFREYCLRQGPLIMREQIECNLMRLQSAVEQQEGLEWVIREGLNTLFGVWRTSYPQSASSEQNSNNPQATQDESGSSFVADSGVVFESQLSSRGSISQEVEAAQPHKFGDSIPQSPITDSQRQLASMAQEDSWRPLSIHEEDLPYLPDHWDFDEFGDEREQGESFVGTFPSTDMTHGGLNESDQNIDAELQSDEKHLWNGTSLIYDYEEFVSSNRAPRSILK